MAIKVFSLLLILQVVILLALAQDVPNRRRVVRVRGRTRGRAGARRLNGGSAAPQPTNTVASNQNKQPSQCPELEGLQVYPDLTSCHNFYKCANGTLTYEPCPNGLLFNPNTALTGSVFNHCSYNWATDCGDRPVDDSPIPSGRCDYQYGIFSAGRCQPSYVKCVEGIENEIPCDIGLVYDPRIHSCNWPDQVEEEEGCNPSELLGGFTCPGVDQLTPLEQRFAPFPRFAVKGRPALYIICVNNLPRLQNCGAGTFFDESTLGCVEAF